MVCHELWAKWLNLNPNQGSRVDLEVLDGLIVFSYAERIRAPCESIKNVYSRHHFVRYYRNWCSSLPIFTVSLEQVVKAEGHSLGMPETK